MFTSGMKESSQREIELKGITSKGLEKVIEVIYTSTTTLDGDDIFDVIGAATHMQVGDIVLTVVNGTFGSCMKCHSVAQIISDF